MRVSTYNRSVGNGDISGGCSDCLSNMLSDEAIIAVLETPESLENPLEELVPVAETRVLLFL